MIGARADGTKELIAVEDGYRETAESWKTPRRARAHGRRGRWRPRLLARVRDVWLKTRAQRDWFHKLGNSLDKLRKRLQPRVKAALHEVMYADTRAHAREAITRFGHRLRRQVPEGRRDVGTGRRCAADLL